jgi:hypothetical protein
MSDKVDPQIPPMKETYSDSTFTEKAASYNESIEDSPIEEVRAAVPPTDDTSLPTATFRAWFWGIVFSSAISFTNQVMSLLHGLKTRTTSIC